MYGGIYRARRLARISPYQLLSVSPGPGRAEQKGYRGDTVFHAPPAESRDGNGGGDDPENLGADLGGVEASARRRELPEHGR